MPDPVVSYNDNKPVVGSKEGTPVYKTGANTTLRLLPKQPQKVAEVEAPKQQKRPTAWESSPWSEGGAFYGGRTEEEYNKGLAAAGLDIYGDPIKEGNPSLEGKFFN